MLRLLLGIYSVLIFTLLAHSPAKPLPSISCVGVLPLKPGVGPYIAIHATLTARDFFLAYFYLSDPFTFIFPKPLPISPVLAVANTWFLCMPVE